MPADQFPKSGFGFTELINAFGDKSDGTKGVISQAQTAVQDAITNLKPGDTQGALQIQMLMSQYTQIMSTTTQLTSALKQATSEPTRAIGQ